jgi:hypothetical protein
VIKKQILIPTLFFIHGFLFAEAPFCGYWKIVDSRDGFIQTIVAVYEHEGIIYGRNIVNFDEDTGDLIDTIYAPSLRVPAIEDSPFLTEINLFWGLEKSDGKWRHGRILDPRSGRTFACVMWPQDDTLIIRGRWGPFFRNQLLYRVSDGDFPEAFHPPDMQGWKPMVPVF